MNTTIAHRGPGLSTFGMMRVESLIYTAQITGEIEDSQEEDPLYGADISKFCTPKVNNEEKLINSGSIYK